MRQETRYSATTADNRSTVTEVFYFDCLMNFFFAERELNLRTKKLSVGVKHAFFYMTFLASEIWELVKKTNAEHFLSRQKSSFALNLISSSPLTYQSSHLSQIIDSHWRIYMFCVNGEEKKEERKSERIKIWNNNFLIRKFLLKFDGNRLWFKIVAFFAIFLSDFWSNVIRQRTIRQKYQT